MRVITRSGLSAISAFATGIGAAVGIDLKMEVTFHDTGKNDRNISRSLEYLNGKYRKNYFPGIEVRSDIPPSVGLKSSSALTAAIVLGFLGYNELDETTAAVDAAECSRYNGTSITGALDDISASLWGGLNITDNAMDSILLHKKLAERKILVAWPLGSKRKTVDLDLTGLNAIAPAVSSLRKLLDLNMLYEAMVLNGMYHASVLGFDRTLVKYFLASGARYVSFSGKGPAVFAIFEDDGKMREAAEAFNLQGYSLRPSKISNKKAEVI